MGLIDNSVIQLICMLVCITVVVCFFIYYYNKGTDIQEPKAKIQKLHIFYVSGILVFIIIELVTGFCMGSNSHSDILSYVSFAATLSSLIMSIVAIIFTIVTSNRGDEQYKKIDNASDKVIDTLNKFTEKTSDIDKSVESFKTIASELSMRLDDLSMEMGGTHSDVSEMKRMLSDQQIHPDEHKQVSDEEAHNKEFINNFVSISSFDGNIALYACALAKDKEKTFAIKQISQNDISYTFGFLVAAISAGVIVGKVLPDSCIITNYYPGLKESVNNAIDAYIKRQTDDSVKNELLQTKKSIEDLFA